MKAAREVQLHPDFAINNPAGEPVGHFTGRCMRCGSKDLWDDATAYGCNHCKTTYFTGGMGVHLVSNVSGKVLGTVFGQSDVDLLVAAEKASQRTALAQRLHQLLMDAHREGFVVEVDLDPLPPLAMGNYQMIGTIRPAREKANG